jgi:putative intracellular protease/amidase
MTRLFRPFVALFIGFVLASSSAAAHDMMGGRKKVAILIFGGAEAIDYAGPYEVFNAQSFAFDVYTVAATAAPVATGTGLQVTPNYTFATAPQADVVIIPGGMVENVEHDEATLNWIRTQTAHAQYTMSVCNGAFVLANTGLLDGLTATTTRTNIDRLRADHPAIKVVRDRRIVDNGKIVTTGGVSAGIDGSLHVLGKMLGQGNEQADALYMEYDAQTESGYLPATFAVNAIPDVGMALFNLGDWTLLATGGDARHWEFSAAVESKLAPAELKSKLDAIYSGAGKWTASDSGDSQARDAQSSSWKFSAADGRHWTAMLKLQPVSSQAGHYNFSITVAEVAH